MQMIDLSEMVAREHPNNSERETTRDWIVTKIKELDDARVVMGKALAELDALGADKVERVIRMIRTFKDPDAQEPVLKVGPHGPGCECVADEDGCSDEGKVN